MDLAPSNPEAGLVEVDELVGGVPIAGVDVVADVFRDELEVKVAIGDVAVPSLVDPLELFSDLSCDVEEEMEDDEVLST